MENPAPVKKPHRQPQRSRTADALRDVLGGRHYQVLLVSLIAFVIAQPLWLSTAQPISLGIFLTILLSTSLLVTSQTRISLAFGLIIGMPMIVSMWLSIIGPTVTTSFPFTLFSMVSGMIFFLFVSAMMLRDVLRVGRVTGDTLYGAACVYLLFAVTFSMAYAVIDVLDPNAFNCTTAIIRLSDGRIHTIELLYFSLVTLTTLGYGDISPVSPIARALASIEAVTGVLYSALLVARLVGMYAAAHRDSDQHGDRSGDTS